MTVVRIDGLRELRRDLRRIDKTLPTQLNRALRKTAEPIRAEAARLAPYSGRRTRPSTSRAGTTGSAQDVLAYIDRQASYRPKPHLRSTIRVSTARSSVAIVSNAPHARIVHFGGRHPLFGDRSHWYTQKPTMFIPRAIQRFEFRIRRDLAETVEREARSAGFRIH